MESREVTGIESTASDAAVASASAPDQLQCQVAGCPSSFSTRQARFKHTKRAHADFTPLGSVQLRTGESDSSRDNLKCPYCEWATEKRRKQRWQFHIEPSHPGSEVPGIEWASKKEKTEDESSTVPVIIYPLSLISTAW